ncbi:hypothetical protein LOCC1_G006581 [Lachnellula occidentalis]|uniref:Uncharacterized protein n=1 Tax=Lachnellula occidentalis TaxID=215460 RepID=A0A8H8U657_9HELO|nr:hypothetical protein LOCC1_G006581 [Lachnellula occidentalis]
MTGWSEEVVLGWQVFCAMLRFARDERRCKLIGTSDSKEKAKKDDFQAFLEISDDDMSIDERGNDELEWDSDVEEDICLHSKSMTGNFYGRSKAIGTLWAAIQTELLTNRRLTEDDPWISENFNMRSLLSGLDNGGRITIPLVEEDMMNAFCQCNRFLEVTDEACAYVDEVCIEYFSNTTTYIMIPKGNNDS